MLFKAEGQDKWVNAEVGTGSKLQWASRLRAKSEII